MPLNRARLSGSTGPVLPHRSVRQSENVETQEVQDAVGVRSTDRFSCIRSAVCVRLVSHGARLTVRFSRSRGGARGAAGAVAEPEAAGAPPPPGTESHQEPNRTRNRIRRCHPPYLARAEALPSAMGHVHPCRRDPLLRGNGQGCSVIVVTISAASSSITPAAAAGASSALMLLAVLYFCVT